MRKVWGFGDSILKGAVLSDGPAVKYAAAGGLPGAESAADGL